MILSYFIFNSIPNIDDCVSMRKTNGFELVAFHGGVHSWRSESTL